MDSDRGLPLPQAPYDSLRCGLSTLKDEISPKHPVQLIQEQDTFKNRCRSLRELYGTAFPARMQIERQILQRRGRLPPLPSSNFGEEVYFGEVGGFTFESYLNDEEISEAIPMDSHSKMEAMLGLQQYPCKRAMP